MTSLSPIERYGMMIRRGLLLVLTACGVLALPVRSEAQDGRLTLRDAVRIGLEANNGAKIAALEREKAEKNVSWGAAGFLPTFDASAGVNGSLNNTHQDYVTGETVERSGAGAKGYFAALDLNWRLFDGFGSFARLDRLEAERDQATIAERGEREALVADIAATYFNLVRLQRLLDVQGEAIRLSLARRDLAQARIETGAGIRFELTQAQVDLDADSATLLETGLLLNDARIHLNRLLNRSPLTPIDPADSITVGIRVPTMDELHQKMLQENVDVRDAVIQGEIARANRKLAASELYPNLTMNLGYDLAGSESDASLVLSNRTSGINYNLTASINLFNGFVTKQKIETAEIDIRQSDLQYADAVAEGDASIATLYQQYSQQAQLVAFEQDRIGAARENLQLAGDRLDLGAVTPLEVRGAQTAFIEAENRLVEAEYRTALLQLSLLQLSGDILSLGE